MLDIRNYGKGWLEPPVRQLLDLQGEGVLWSVELGKSLAMLGL